MLRRFDKNEAVAQQCIIAMGYPRQERKRNNPGIQETILFYFVHFIHVISNAI